MGSVLACKPQTSDIVRFSAFKGFHSPAERDSSARKGSQGHYDSDDSDDDLGFVKPVATKKSFLDDDDDDDDDDDEEKEKDDDEEEEDKPKKKSPKGFFSDDESSEDSDDEESASGQEFISKVEIPPTLLVPDFSSETKFQVEVSDIVSSVLSKSCRLEEFHIQAKSLRMSFNTTDDAVACAIIRKLLKVAAEPAGKSIPEMKNSIHSIMDEWGEALCTKYLTDGRFILEYVYYLCHEEDNPFEERFFPIIIHALYQDEILSEEVIFDWESDQKSSPVARQNPYFVACSDLLKWLHSDS